MEEPFNIVDLFLNSAKQYPNKIAIIDKNEQICFSEFERQVKQTALYFIHKGIKKADRVMIFVPMSIDLYRIILALFHIGATAVFLDEWVNGKRMEECCKAAQCKAFIGILKARVFAFFISELRKIPIRLGTSFSAVSESITVDSTVHRSDTALITFTTGSTGAAKAAKRTHGFLSEQFNALIEKIEPKPDDIDMPVLPIVLLINLGAGCTSVIAEFKASKPESMNVKKILEQINANKVNRITASPFFIKQLSSYLINNTISTSSITKIFTGGAPVFPTEVALYRKAFPETKIEIVYGSTEAEPISSINASELIIDNEKILKTGLNVGIPYRKAKVRIIKIKTEPITCVNENELNELMMPTGEIGEIIVSGPHVLNEYFNNEAALKQNKIFVDKTCWHRTGDSGYMDKNGRLFLTGRCSTLIYCGNKIIAPFIYENYFSTIEEIEMGTVMQLNNELLVIIELKKGSQKDELRDRIHSVDIEFNKIKFISTIPRDPRHHSKIDYEKLKINLLK
ncbi:MAG TPA: AMP-binding protein [Saprospiraceae bacterium]|nr:AMP-binding protein [Saprospiraceae bacterium]